MALLCSSVPVSQVTVSQNAQDPETAVEKWNSVTYILLFKLYFTFRDMSKCLL